MVNQPTRKNKTLTVVITDLRRFLIEPEIIDPVPVDTPGKGVPSDHNGVLVEPLNNVVSTKGTSKVIKHVRPMPDSSVIEYRQSLSKVDWSLMLDERSSSNMVDVFQKMTSDLVDIHFPLKKVTISPYDKPYFTERLRALRRRRQRIYRREGKSSTYLQIKKQFDEELKGELKKYIDKIEAEVVEGKCGSSYSALRKFGNREFQVPRDCETFDIPEFIDNDHDD